MRVIWVRRSRFSTETWENNNFMSSYSQHQVQNISHTFTIKGDVCHNVLSKNLHNLALTLIELFHNSFKKPQKEQRHIICNCETQQQKQVCISCHCHQHIQNQAFQLCPFLSLHLFTPCIIKSPTHCHNSSNDFVQIPRK